MDLPPLPPLPAAAAVHSAELDAGFRGPSARSNWVVPGMVLCGDQAVSLDEPGGRAAVLASGVTTVLNLRTKSEAKAAFEYAADCRRLSPATKFVSFPIVDQTVATDENVERLLPELLERLAGGEVLYIHCRGGHGRTGTICALLLGRLYNLPADAALARVQAYHDTRHNPVFTAQPGTPAAALFPPQIEQVRRLLLSPVIRPCLCLVHLHCASVALRRCPSLRTKFPARPPARARVGPGSQGVPAGRGPSGLSGRGGGRAGDRAAEPPGAGGSQLGTGRAARLGRRGARRGGGPGGRRPAAEPDPARVSRADDPHRPPPHGIDGSGGARAGGCCCIRRRRRRGRGGGWDEVSVDTAPAVLAGARRR